MYWLNMGNVSYSNVIFSIHTWQRTSPLLDHIPIMNVAET